MKTDVFVVGGGPAGLAAAIALRKEGCSVILADHNRPPIEKACGEGIMPQGRELLMALGIKDWTLRSTPIRGIRFIDGETEADSTFPDRPGLGVRRTVLHSALVERAMAVGVKLLWEQKKVEVCDRSVTVEGQPVEAGLIVGADGHNSKVRRAHGFVESDRPGVRYGFRRHFRGRCWSDKVEIYWGPNWQVYVTPLGDGEFSVASLAEDSRFRLGHALRLLPELNRKIEQHGQYTGDESGGVTASRRVRNVVRGRVALIGDASGSVDAITGEGLCLCFEQGLALAAAYISGNLARYSQTHRKLQRRPRMMSTLLLMLASRPALRHRVVGALSRQPDLFDQFVAIHTGQSSLLGFELEQVLRFGRYLLFA